MPLVFDPASLFTAATEAEIFDLAMGIANGVGLPTSTWQVGDPTRTGLEVLSARLAAVDVDVAGYFASGFLSSAKGAWLTVMAREIFQEERVLATYASGTATLTNATTAKFAWDPNGLTLKNSSTGKTYKNTAAVTLLAGGSAVLTYSAEEAGSGSTALVNSIELQSTIKGVSVSSSTAAIGADEQSDDSLRLVCRAKVSSLSPNGAYQAYEAIAKNVTLTGVASCRKAQATPGAVGMGTPVVYVSNISALLLGVELLAVTDAIVKYATPVGMLPTVLNATIKNVQVYGSITISPMGITREVVLQRVTQKLQNLFLDIPIGGGSGPGFTTGNLGSLLLEERVFQDLENWTPGIVRAISISSDLVSDLINPGVLVVLGGLPNVTVSY